MYEGKEVLIPVINKVSKIQKVKKVDNKYLAYLEDETIISLDILRTKDGKHYLTEEE